MMEEKVMKLGKDSLLSLYGTLEINIKKLCSERKTKLFCKKYEELITPKFIIEHECLKPKRIYRNAEGEEVVIYCPHLMTLKGTEFYKANQSSIYEAMNEILEITPQFKEKIPRVPLKREDKEDLFKKQEENLRKLLMARPKEMFKE
jgi:hypothetical protein